jgi:TonB family protein
MKLQTKKKDKFIHISLSISIILHVIAIAIYVLFLPLREEQNTDAILVEMLKMPLQRSMRRPRHKPHIMELNPHKENQPWRKPNTPNLLYRFTLQSVPSTYADLAWDSSSYLREPMTTAGIITTNLSILNHIAVPLKNPVRSPLYKIDTIVRNNWQLDIVPPQFVKFDTPKIEADFFHNAKQDELSVFLAKIKEKVERAKRYPSLARKKEFEGVVKLEFCILQDGSLKEVTITQPSKYEMLNKVAVETIRRAHPYPKIPKVLNKAELWIELPIVFQLKEK